MPYASIPGRRLVTERRRPLPILSGPVGATERRRCEVSRPNGVRGRPTTRPSARPRRRPSSRGRSGRHRVEGTDQPIHRGHGA